VAGGQTDEQNSGIINACAAAADELKETRSLASALDAENTALKERLVTEQRISASLVQINDARIAEAAALRSALTAKDETIAAKNALIENRGETIDALKKKSRSPLKRIADVLIGVAVFAIFK